MPEFKYRSKGSANDDWNENVIEAKDKSEAIAKLDELYGVNRNAYGEQTNTDMIQVEILN